MSRLDVKKTRRHLLRVVVSALIALLGVTGSASASEHKKKKKTSKKKAKRQIACDKTEGQPQFCDFD